MNVFGKPVGGNESIGHKSPEFDGSVEYILSAALGTAANVLELPATQTHLFFCRERPEDAARVVPQEKFARALGLQRITNIDLTKRGNSFQCTQAMKDGAPVGEFLGDFILIGEGQIISWSQHTLQGAEYAAMAVAARGFEHEALHVYAGMDHKETTPLDARVHDALENYFASPATFEYFRKVREQYGQHPERLDEAGPCVHAKARRPVFERIAAESGFYDGLLPPSPD